MHLFQLDLVHSYQVLTVVWSKFQNLLFQVQVAQLYQQDLRFQLVSVTAAYLTVMVFVMALRWKTVLASAVVQLKI